MEKKRKSLGKSDKNISEIQLIYCDFTIRKLI